jgi:hypothetical protein
MGKREVHTGLLRGKLRKRDRLEDLGVDGRIILQWIFKKYNGTGTGFIWLRIGTSGELLLKQ